MLHQIFSVSNTKHSEKYIYYNLLAYFLPLLLLLAGLNSDWYMLGCLLVLAGLLAGVSARIMSGFLLSLALMSGLSWYSPWPSSASALTCPPAPSAC